MSFADTVSSGLDDVRRDRSTPEDEPRTLETDDVFHLLQTKRRRDVLRYLRDADGPVEMRELAEQVAAREQGTSVEALTSSERQRVYISLYQSHLPKLEAEGVIEYQRNRGIVTRRPLAAALDPFIRDGSTAPATGTWAYRYAGAALLCGCLLAGVFLGAVGGAAAAALVTATFSALSLVHLYAVRSPLRVVE